MPLPQPEQLIAKMADELRDLAQQDDTVMVGIHTGGAWVAKQLHQQLGLQSELGLLDISFYRDDFSQSGLHPKVKGSQLPEIENKTVILVDDVIMSGRTIRAAMNELFDYGRPEKIVLACLLDVGHRELPIQADVVGDKVERPTNQRIKLTGPTPLVLTTVNLK
ncbi:bifunctional pyr operon transcriptional regulator/uracil phosphoribosyltransferase PyrR [Bermanella sp. WJH001]|uniref:bifunctional pyr operon transcriptional regulator/uracil phosphoribosyltransferase PyrR n=1 Tax=Bermanella sp. WJH001 TaxID=3048005 RepID=UPI0024BE4075|nr:bifunctional pyr operon transcriptional regulator/uracil phosphoribosyltransferase PyrR [Bermanella sp. WJH001]MDJ1538983.1 bifunctional pyr operon transcriptional regulator/uracil phosphoribosyltransferase PyrR [Bermanella sp. WJH001]